MAGNVYTQDFFTDRRNHGDGDTRIGQMDRIWYDPKTNTLRVGNGLPGGRIIGFGGNGAGTFNYNVRTVYTDYTFVESDYYVGVVSNTAITITLPPGEEGRICVVKDQSSNCSIHNLTINPQVPDTIDNQNSVILALNNAAVDMIYTNGGWRII